MARAVLTGDAAAAAETAAAFRPGRIPAAARLEIHRANVAISLVKALEAAFPRRGAADDPALLQGHGPGLRRAAPAAAAAAFHLRRPVPRLPRPGRTGAPACPGSPTWRGWNGRGSRRSSLPTRRRSSPGGACRRGRGRGAVDRLPSAPQPAPRRVAPPDPGDLGGEPGTSGRRAPTGRPAARPCCCSRPRRGRGRRKSFSPAEAAFLSTILDGRALAEASAAAEAADPAHDLQRALLANLTRGSFRGLAPRRRTDGLIRPIFRSSAT